MKIIEIDEVKNAVLAKLRDLISDKSLIIDDQTLLISDNWLDSMDLLTLISWAEDSYGITLDPGSLTPENFETPDTITSLISKARA